MNNPLQRSGLLIARWLILVPFKLPLLWRGLGEANIGLCRTYVDLEISLISSLTSDKIVNRPS
jgi:hypothetical protein